MHIIRKYTPVFFTVVVLQFEIVNITKSQLQLQSAFVFFFSISESYKQAYPSNLAEVTSLEHLVTLLTLELTPLDFVIINTICCSVQTALAYVDLMLTNQRCRFQMAVYEGNDVSKAMCKRVMSIC